MLRVFFMRRAQGGQAKKPFFQKRKKGFFAQDKQRKKEGRISFTLPKKSIHAGKNKFGTRIIK